MGAPWCAACGAGWGAGTGGAGHLDRRLEPLDRQLDLVEVELAPESHGGRQQDALEPELHGRQMPHALDRGVGGNDRAHLGELARVHAFAHQQADALAGQQRCRGDQDQADEHRGGGVEVGVVQRVAQAHAQGGDDDADQGRRVLDEDREHQSSMFRCKAFQRLSPARRWRSSSRRVTRQLQPSKNAASASTT
jgi:hypothetical protein